MAPAAKTPVAKTQSAKNRVARHAAKVDAKAGNAERKLAEQRTPVQYQPGFGNHFVTEAVAGALPVGRNSPQRPPLGLYAEQISGTSFTTMRAENRRTWTYRIQPSVVHRPYARIGNGMIRSAPFNEAEATPTQLRRSPFPIPKKPTDFVEGIITLGGNGDVAMQVGMAVHIYAANRSMADRMLLQCRWRNADRAAAGPRPFRHRARHYRSGLRRDRRDAARPAFPGRTAGRTVARLYLRELRRHAAAAGARPARRQRSRQSARFSGAGRGLRGRHGAVQPGRQVPGQFVGGGDGPFAARRRRLARQFRAVQIRSRALQRRRHDQLRSSRSVDLFRADRALRPGRRGQYRFRRFSRRAGSSARIRSARPGFTATS